MAVGFVKPNAKFNAVIEPLKYNATSNKNETTMNYVAVNGGANNIYYNEAKVFIRDLLRFSLTGT